MKIIIVSSGRSHLLNLAKYLLKEGHDVYFYCLSPYSTIERFGFPKSRTKSFCYYLLPLVLLLFKVKLPRKIKKILFGISDLLIDNLSALFLRRCDVFIGASNVANYSAKVARKKYNAIVICDSGTLHLKEQGLLNNGNLSVNFSLNRAFEFYEHSDYIMVAGEHVKKSFIKNGVRSDKLIVNSYGVDIDIFKPTILDQSIIYDVIFVGTWSYIKGCDLLAEACLNKLKIKLLHVGGIGDLKLPSSEFFTHVGIVPQNELIKYYSKAKIFILPSRSDGFGLVLSQAMAAGLPIIFSKNTGGPDLVKVTNCSNFYYRELDKVDVESIAKNIKDLLMHIDISFNKERNYLGMNRELLSWEYYGKRYLDFLNKVL